MPNNNYLSKLALPTTVSKHNFIEHAYEPPIAGAFETKGDGSYGFNGSYLKEEWEFDLVYDYSDGNNIAPGTYIISEGTSTQFPDSYYENNQAVVGIRYCIKRSGESDYGEWYNCSPQTRMFTLNEGDSINVQMCPVKNGTVTDLWLYPMIRLASIADDTWVPAGSTVTANTTVEYSLKDAEARQLIEDLGHALYWAGVTTTALTDGATTNPITVGGEQVEVHTGAVVQYVDANDEPLEFAFDGTKWQLFGYSNLGALAFKSSASGSYTPAGSVSITQGTDTTESITPFGTAGTLPDAYFTVSGETATFNWSAGTLPTAGTAVTAITARGTDTASFSGTAATITVE